MKQFTDLMIDIESLGNRSNSIILSIAAVPFNIGEKFIKNTDSYFSVNISIKSCLSAGLKLDESALLWWLKQSEEARETAFFNEHTINLGEALKLFYDYVCALMPKDLKIWGNSARFDLGIIENAYTAINKQIPWKFSKERDVRTLVAFAPEIKSKMRFVGTKHDPIDDSMHQIKYCNKIYNSLVKD